MSLPKLVAQLAPAVVGAVVAEVAKGDATKAAELEAMALPIIEQLAAEAQHDERQLRRTASSALLAELAVKLVDTVVIPDDEHDMRRMADKAVLLAHHVLDRADELCGVEREPDELAEQLANAPLSEGQAS